ncbi:MAG: type II toxin-antitoxin system VapB family antitoxin [Acidobacteriota bacterium]
MRTTLRLDDDLLQEAITLTALMDRALRETLARDDWGGPDPETRPLPTYSGRGLRAGVDLDDGAALLDLMEGGDDSA